ncbi:hypothetical protein [Nitrosophilus kaiyonis]|uniref:hypothetical protein n=1 Tax=Nitrosophilus kaiyonis TaxID=2930200 RepID=UPI0024919C93|nr:hypothetical protein [Nitrosophilus kaiyonis]
MSDLDKLKEKDIEEIYHKTYIARKYIKALLDKDFSKFDRLKALGFVKIIEREFNYDLSDLKKEIDEYFAKKSLIKPKDEDQNLETINETDNNKKENKKYLILIILIIILIALFFIIFNGKKETKKEKVENKQKVKKEKFFSNEKNESETKTQSIQESESEENVTISDEVNKTVSKEIKTEAILPTIAIIPKQKVWIGIIYLDDYSRKNYITSFPIELNSSRDQLIVTGHGNIKIDIDGNITDYNSKGKLRFLYRAGELEKIDKETFIRFNRGKNW